MVVNSLDRLNSNSHLIFSYFPPFFRSLASFKYSFSLSLSAGSSLRPLDLSPLPLFLEGPLPPLVDLDLASAAEDPALERPFAEAAFPLAAAAFFLDFFLLSSSELELSLSELESLESLSELSLSELESELESDESLSELESLEELELEERPRLLFTFFLPAAAAAGRLFVTAPVPFVLLILSSNAPVPVRRRSAFFLGNGMNKFTIIYTNHCQPNHNFTQKRTCYWIL